MKLDNQQGRLEAKMNWLGGIIDGEGWVTATAGHTSTGHGNKYDHRRYIPQIGVVNTDKELIKETLSVLDEAEIPYHVKVRPGSRKNTSWKEKTEIRIVGMKRCLNACNKLLPYLRSYKRDKMRYLKEWIEHRLTSPSVSYSNGSHGGRKQPYTDKDYQLLNLIRDASCTLRDYTPGSTKVDEDIVQSAMKVAV